MVLLRGLNYDYSGQQMTTLVNSVQAEKTSIFLENTEGFVEDDYIILAPGTEKSEVVKIGAAVVKNQAVTISATKFPHSAGIKIFRTNYNQMKFYECATATGTYTLCASGTVDMTFATSYTNFDFSTATADYYYKRTFYNETTTAESDIDDSSYWQTTDQDLYVTPEEMRIYLQFDKNDFPSLVDLRFFIKIAQMNVDLDLDTTSENILFIGTLLNSKVQVMTALASKSLSKGYVQVNAEGRTISKAYQELRLEAENALQEYKEFILRNNRREVTGTNFMDDTTLVDDYTRTDIINLMNGTTNAVDFQNYYGLKRY